MNHACFFNNHECEYFPCHQTDDPDAFNCLFCYCPLYMLGERCGGDFRYIENGIKDCSACLIPHQKDAAAYICSRFPEIAEEVRRKHGTDSIS